MSARPAAAPRAVAAAGLLALALAASACTVGSGAGSAVGSLFVVSCDDSNSRAQMNPAPPYSLDPTFFAGEPIEDVCPSPGTCPGPHMNRLLIRLQRTGNAIEVTDTLYFDVDNALQVAECLRGQVKNGVPSWDTRLVTGADGATIPGLPWCDWRAVPDGGVADAGGADGGVADAAAADSGAADAGAADAGPPVVMTATIPRINLSTQDYVRASLAPLGTCVDARSVAVALPGSWIEFQNFGSADQSNLPPAMRTDLDGDFKVNFGERLRASFHLVLGDEAVEYAIQTRAAVPAARIGGELDGMFDFDLERGRAAQPFP